MAGGQLAHNLATAPATEAPAAAAADWAGEGTTSCSSDGVGTLLWLRQKTLGLGAAG